MNPIFRIADDLRRALAANAGLPAREPNPTDPRPTLGRALVGGVLDALARGDGDAEEDFLDPGRAAAVYGTDVNGATIDPDWYRR